MCAEVVGLGFQKTKTAPRIVSASEGASEIGSTNGLRCWIRLVKSFKMICGSSSGSSGFERSIDFKLRLV